MREENAAEVAYHSDVRRGPLFALSADHGTPEGCDQHHSPAPC